MNEFEKRPVTVKIIVEGPTEAKFVNYVLKPYLKEKNIILKLCIVGNKDNMGGSVGINRLMDFIRRAARDSNCYVTTMFDFYGCIDKDWPELKNISQPKFNSLEKSAAVITDLKERVQKKFPNLKIRMFVPYVSMYEFEALLFSEPNILASELDIPDEQFMGILKNYRTPEEINNSIETAPSKRIEKICQLNKQTYDKVADGVSIAKEIGIDAMRAKCPIFNAWLETLENLSSSN